MTQQPLRMLSIDDKMITSDLDRAGYRKMGVEVRAARSFEEAEKIVAKEPIDVIVINMDYDKVNAPLICKHFKAQPTTTPRPVILISVNGNSTTRHKALAANADLFVVQPVPRQHFIEKIRQLLAQQIRGNERVRVAGEAEMKIGKEKHSMPVGDVSTTGLLLGSTREFPTGTVVEVAFEIPSYKKPIEASGEVVRILHNAIDGSPEFAIAIAIKFTSFRGDSQKRLEKYVEKTSHQNSRMMYYI